MLKENVLLSNIFIKNKKKMGLKLYVSFYLSLSTSQIFYRYIAILPNAMYHNTKGVKKIKY